MEFTQCPFKIHDSPVLLDGLDLYRTCLHMYVCSVDNVSLKSVFRFLLLAVLCPSRTYFRLNRRVCPVCDSV